MKSKEKEGPHAISGQVSPESATHYAAQCALVLCPFRHNFPVFTIYHNEHGIKFIINDSCRQLIIQRITRVPQQPSPTVAKAPDHPADMDDCIFTVYVRTGSAIKGGTDSIVSLRLYDANGWYVEIPNLEAWGGIMEPGHNYYERGNLDIFSGRAPCLTAPACALNLTSDGSGDNHGWYCNYVEVTTTGPHVPCAQQLFTVEQWLATDISPFELTAIRNSCSYGVDRLSHAVMKSSASSSM
ncbi:PLAT domain-containing protein 2 [Vitis vinifera]|uniref:PLAT domain-containing protein 2 n=1 Tax=Vitis vinifera TaxID=29760 RepID=A0A438FC34_VITVI|nr:PLAT domain-containing protein 2 [Vitis vinifera]